MTVQDILSIAPENIHDFDLITKDGLEINADKKSVISFFENIPNGYLEEVLLSYDNHHYRYSMRVVGRGDNIHVKLEYMRLIYDGGSPISAEILEEKIEKGWNLRKSVMTFLLWVEECVTAK